MIHQLLFLLTCPQPVETAGAHGHHDQIVHVRRTERHRRVASRRAGDASRSFETRRRAPGGLRLVPRLDVRSPSPVHADETTPTRHTTTASCARPARNTRRPARNRPIASRQPLRPQSIRVCRSTVPCQRLEPRQAGGGAVRFLERRRAAFCLAAARRSRVLAAHDARLVGGVVVVGIDDTRRHRPPPACLERVEAHVEPSARAGRNRHPGHHRIRLRRHHRQRADEGRAAAEPAGLARACRRCARHIPVGHGGLLADLQRLVGLLEPPPSAGGRAVDGAAGAQLRRGAPDRAPAAARSALPVQCVEHHLGAVAERAETCAQDDRALGRPVAPLARSEEPA